MSLPTVLLISGLVIVGSVLYYFLNKKIKTMATTLAQVLSTLQGEATTLASIQSGIAAGVGLQPGQVAVNQSDIDGLASAAQANATTATSILASLPAQTTPPPATPPAS